MARPPSFTDTLGDLASSRMLSRHTPNRSCRRPRSRRCRAACRRGRARSCVSGKARARSIRSGSCGSSSQASNESGRAARAARSPRGSRRVDRGPRLAPGRAGPARSVSASHEAQLRMPRKRPPPAAMWASSTALTAVAQRQVGVADDAGAGARLAVEAAGAHRRHAVDELGLADRRASRPVRRPGTSRRTPRRPWRGRCGRCRCRPAARPADSAACA